MGKACEWVHSLNTNFRKREVRYLKECLILNIEINQMELVKVLVCLIKPSPALGWIQAQKLLCFLSQVAER